MSRLFDRLRADGKHWPECSVFIADNIFVDSAIELISGHLPYRRVWIETRRNGETIGALCDIEPDIEDYTEDGEKINSLDRAFLSIGIWVEKQKNKATLYWSDRITIDLHTYLPIKHESGPLGSFFREHPELADVLAVYRSNKNPNIVIAQDGPLHPQLVPYNTMLLSPVFAAINLLNCNNVQIVDQVPPPKLSKKHEKRYGYPLVTFKTLHVTPMAKPHYKQEIIAIPPQQNNANSLPLHEIRGHVKDYRDGKGLFGKYKGVYWWNNHVKGDPLNGVVVKDYEIDNLD